MTATIKINTDSFMEQLRRLQIASGRAGGSMVRYWSRKLLKKMAWDTRRAARRFPNSGRLRAGWYPAAAAIGVSTVYAGSAPNKGEGSCIDGSKSTLAPRITMTNSVPFGPYVKGIAAALQGSVSRAEAEAKGEAESLYMKELKLFGAPV